MTAYPKSWRGNVPTLPGPLALARQGADEAGWYDDARASISRYAARHGLTVATVADVLALTSPRQSVSGNVRRARAYIESGSLDGTLPSVQAAVSHWEGTGEIRGMKTRAFSDALQGDPDAVVIDVWIFRAFDLDFPSMTRKRYRDVSARVRRIATLAGMTPRDCQAAIWVSTRRAFGFIGHAPLSFD